MSPISPAAQRRRSCLLATTFLVPALSFGVSAAKAQQIAQALPPIEITSPDENRTRAKPKIDQEHEFAPRGAQRRANPPAQRRARRRRRRDQRSGRPAVQRHRRHIDVGHHGRGNRALPGANRAGNHRADARRATDQPVWRRQRREDQRRPPRIRRLCDLQYPGADQRPQAQRHRYGRGRFLDHSARFDRAHRDHPRQQRRGAVRRQRDRRRHQHRAEERRRRPAGRDARRRRRRLVQRAHGFGLGRDQLRPVVDLVLRQRHQVRRLPRQQRARPAQRRRQSQLHHARPLRVPDPVRRRPEAGFPGRPSGRSLDRHRRTRHQPPRRRYAVRLRQPAGRQRHRRLHQDLDERRRPHRRRRRAGQEAAGRLLQIPLPTVTSTPICRPGRSRLD